MLIFKSKYNDFLQSWNMVELQGNKLITFKIQRMLLSRSRSIRLILNFTISLYSFYGL